MMRNYYDKYPDAAMNLIEQDAIAASKNRYVVVVTKVGDTIENLTLLDKRSADLFFRVRSDTNLFMRKRIFEIYEFNFSDIHIDLMQYVIYTTLWPTPHTLQTMDVINYTGEHKYHLDKVCPK